MLPPKVASRVPAALKAPAVKRLSPPSVPKAAIRKAPTPVAPPPAFPKSAIAPPKARNAETGESAASTDGVPCGRTAAH